VIGRGGRFGTAVSPDNKDAVLVEYLGARLPAVFLLLLLQKI
jgi:hypothetical protein